MSAHERKQSSSDPNMSVASKEGPSVKHSVSEPSNLALNGSTVPTNIRGAGDFCQQRTNSQPTVLHLLTPMDTQPQVSRSFVHASHSQSSNPRNEFDSSDDDNNPSESHMSLEAEVAETQLHEPMQTMSAPAQPIASTEESAKSYKTKKTKVIRSRSYSRSPSSSDDDYPVKKSKLSEPVPDSLITLVQRASIHPPAPGEGSSRQPSTSKVYAPPQRELTHKPPRPSRQTEVFYSHPWSPHLREKFTPIVSPYYDSNLPESNFERIPISGYSGLIDGLFPEPSEAIPRCGKPVSILEAVGPTAIEDFRDRHSAEEMITMRSDNIPLPIIPDVPRATPEESIQAVHGLVLDNKTAPVLYRISAFYSSGVKLSSMHIEVTFPDRLDLHTVQLDPVGINIKTGKRGIDITKMIIGDLVWVYALAPTVKFATTKMPLPSTVEEAFHVRQPNVWRVARYALIHRELTPTLGFVTSIISRQNGIFRIYMQGHRQLVIVNRNRLQNPKDAHKIRANSFITAPFRPRQLDYMVFACKPTDGARELASYMAEIQYFPSPPPTPFDIRITSAEHQRQVQDKLRDFTMFEKRPNEVINFLEPLYSTACGTVAAVVADSTDTLVHSAVWTSPDLNRYPVLVQFTIPVGKKTGWAVGHPIQGAYEADILKGKITSVVKEGETLQINAKLDTADGVRCRMYFLNSPSGRIAVATSLSTTTSSTNPVLAMMKHSLLSKILRSDSLGWASARALLSADIVLTSVGDYEYESYSTEVAGSLITLNEDQLGALNLFKCQYPIAAVDSAYGAGKTLCTAVMAKDAVQDGQKILVTAVQNSALDVIGAKIQQLADTNIRAVRYVSETLASDTLTTSPFAIQTLMENFHITHRDLLSETLRRKFENFSRARQQLREFMFSGTDRFVVISEHKGLLFLEERTSTNIQVLISQFLRLYKPNVFLCTVSSALNLTLKQGTWRRIGNSWSSILIDEASMVPEAALMALMSRFQHARFTLIGDSKQLPPYIGTQTVPLAVDVSMRSVLDLVTTKQGTPSCTIRTVYRPHVEMMHLNSEIFYNNTLICGTPPEQRQLLLAHTRMPNPKIPVAFVNIPSQSEQSLTGSHSNVVEANAAHVIARMLMTNRIAPRDILVICLYRDQKFLCDNIFQGSAVTVGTVDSAQGAEKPIVILCTTRTHIEPSAKPTFFSDPKRLNVALSRARDGMFILGALTFLQNAPTWTEVIRWCTHKNLITDLHFFDTATLHPLRPPPGEALILAQSEAGYSVAKQKFCGFRWEAKPTVNEDHVSITLWCNPEMETDSWRCAALITVYSCVGVDDETTLLYRSSHIFRDGYRSTIITPCFELDNNGTVGMHNTSGEAAMPNSKFTKRSEFSNACIAFKNSDMRVFVNKEYLLINSRKFATLFTSGRSGSAASNSDKSESGNDFDVLSSRASVPGQSLEDDSGLNTLLSSQGGVVPSTAVCHEEGVFSLEDIYIKDFIAFLETIYPPFNDITGDNVESVLPTAFHFDVEHIVKKCEVYFGTEDARKLFDLFQRLVFATTYKMTSLQKDSLASLQNARDVLSLLDDPRLQNVSSNLRSLLLETLLERFRSEARTTTSEADGTSTASDF